MNDSTNAQAAPEKKGHRESVLLWLRNNFAAGVAIVLPFAVTFWLIWTIVSFIDRHVAPLLPERWRGYAEAIPGAGVLIAVIGITILGALAANLIGRFVVSTGEVLLARVPLVRTIYAGSKQIFNQIAAPEGASFKEAVLVEFPKPGTWVIGFVTADAVDRGFAALGEDIVAVYVPHAPVPTSGFLIYAARASLRPAGLAPEDALKRIISLGLIKEDAPGPGARATRS